MAAVQLSFGLNGPHGKPLVTSDSKDRDGFDRLTYMFQTLAAPQNVDLFRRFEERDSFSWWANFGIIRAESETVKIWAHYESDEDDFLVLTRYQFRSMLDDWIQFQDDLVAFTKRY